MSLREKINQNPAIVSVVAIVLVVAAIALAIWAMDSSVPEKMNYFAAPDGTGLVELPESKHRGYTEEYDGKTLYRAMVYKCGENGEPFVAALERMPDQIEAQLDETGIAGIGSGMSVQRAAPGSDTWVPVIMADQDKAMQQEMAKMQPTCPDGQQPIPVVPERG